MLRVPGGHTVVVTATSSSTSTSAPSGPSAAGIAAGVVVGVVVVGAVIGGLFFYMRRRRNREIEEDHRRNAAVNSFINGGHPPSSSSGFSDARLDPVMAQRRMSDGSIADNQDYSRKILRVRACPGECAEMSQRLTRFFLTGDQRMRARRERNQISTITPTLTFTTTDNPRPTSRCTTNLYSIPHRHTGRLAFPSFFNSHGEPILKSRSGGVLHKHGRRDGNTAGAI